MCTRGSGGKNGRSPAALSVENGVYPIRLIALPEVPKPHTAPPKPVTNLLEALASIKGQEGLSAMSHTLDQLAISDDGL
jgi:hypothetical protein